jgi:hypothetical protein
MGEQVEELHKRNNMLDIERFTTQTANVPA